MTRRAFLSSLAVLATGAAYGLGAKTPEGLTAGLLHEAGLPPEIELPPAPEAPVAEAPVEQHFPGRPGPRSMKSLPPLRVNLPTIQLEAPVVPISVKYDFRGKLVWETADYVVGHYSNTANPGAEGNCVLSGHISSPRSGAIFSRLPNLEVGHGIVVSTAESSFLYEVADTRVVNPQNVEIMLPGTGSKLTLITCVPDGIYSHRLIVTALPV